MGGWTVDQWAEADALFRRDARWKGSDCAYSVALGGDRVLWLFNDTFIAPDGAGSRAGTPMICNTIGVQDGLDPATATIGFFWDDSGPGPGAFFARRDDAVLWPGPGAMVGSQLLLLMRWISLTGGDAPWGFRYAGDTALLVTNPGDDPTAWAIQTLDVPVNEFGIEVGTGSLLVEDDHVLLFCPGPRHDAHLLRWAREAVEAGSLDEPQWWCGPSGWVSAAQLTEAPAVVLPAAQSEFSVHRLDARTLIQVQAIGTDDAVLAIRTAPDPCGPWSDQVVLHQPHEAARPEAFCYAFKAHPHIPGADLVVTYASNRLSGDVATDESLYWPRFLRVGLPAELSRPRMPLDGPGSGASPQDPTSAADRR